MTIEAKMNGGMLDGVAETLLIPLYARALESQRPDALLRDEAAVSMVARHPAVFDAVRRIRMDDDDRTALVLRNREFDRTARDFLGRYPSSTVVHIGCGLDDRFNRVDDGRVEWFDLDLPEVIALRREHVDGEEPRYHHLSCSAFDGSWFDAVSASGRRPVLFLAEGVLMYFNVAMVKTLVQALRLRFPGSELTFDAFSPFLVRMNNLRLALSRSGMSARYCWGLKRGREIERWDDDIKLLDEWHPFERSEPRLAKVQWMRHFPPLARIMGIYRYRLGSPPQ